MPSAKLYSYSKSLKCGRWKPQPFDKLKQQNDDKKSPHIYILISTIDPG